MTSYNTENGVATVALWMTHLQMLNLTNLVMYQTSNRRSLALAFCLCFVDKESISSTFDPVCG